MLKINANSELIRKFSEIIEGIIKKIEDGDYDKALSDIDGAFKDFFRLGSKFFNSLTEENLLDMVKTNNILDADKCIIMSKLLMEEGRALEKLYDANESFYLYQKSIFLYIEAYLNVDEEVELDKYFCDIELLISQVSEYKLSLKLQKQIISYYFKKGKYDIAENVLYEILENTDCNAESLDYAINFYKTLLSKEDVELTNGNLPREEIIFSLDSLKKRSNSCTL